jgi:hypothetical protein
MPSESNGCDCDTCTDRFAEIREADDDAKAALIERAEAFGVRLINMSYIDEMSVSLADITKLLDLIERKP